MTQPDLYTLRLLRAQSHQLVHEINLMPPDAHLWKFADAEWSAHECLTHLRNVERHVFLWRMNKMATEENPSLPFFDEVAYQKEHWNPAETVAAMLADFVADRAAETALLEKADWARPGQHPMRGTITLNWLANYTLNHTWEHLSQIMRVRLNYETRK
jgi:hypothetical protein